MYQLQVRGALSLILFDYGGKDNISILCDNIFFIVNRDVALATDFAFEISQSKVWQQNKTGL